MSNIFIDFRRQTKQIVDNDREYSRIITAAVINAKFRKLLLSNPRMAIENGFGGEAFNLEQKESERLSAIKASTLAEFASQMTEFPYAYK